MSAPYYSDDKVTLYHGDCLEHPEWWTGADVLVTDPPYGIAYTRGKWMRSHAPDRGSDGIANDLDTSTRDAAMSAWDGRPALVFGSPRVPEPEGVRWRLVFEKPTIGGSLFGSRGPWFLNWEAIFACGDGWPPQTPTRSAVLRTMSIATGGYSGYATKAGHPHAKPLDVMESLIDAAPPGTIADPFAGSGSTLVAAKALGRKAIGVELEERYCEIAARRLSQEIFDFGSIA